MAGLDNPKLKDVLKDVASGVLQLPDFQREWKWDDERIRALIATVTLDYPLGVVMALETGGTSPFKARTLKGAEDAEGKVPDLLLLDGQQRLTSLFQALHRRPSRGDGRRPRQGPEPLVLRRHPEGGRIRPRTATTRLSPFPRIGSSGPTSPARSTSTSPRPSWSAQPATSRCIWSSTSSR